MKKQVHENSCQFRVNKALLTITERRDTQNAVSSLSVKSSIKTGPARSATGDTKMDWRLVYDFKVRL